MNTLGGVEAALDTLAQRAPSLFSKALLIGGWAALIYYRDLTEANDSDFPAPIPDSKERLFSKDLDFTNVWSEEFFDALPDFVVNPAKGCCYLEIEGVRLGFSQVPVTIHPEEAFECSRKYRTKTGTVFSVLDPGRLYREKLAMIQKGRRRPNDPFHMEIAAMFARFELAEAERRMLSAPSEENLEILNLLQREMRDLAPELLPR